VKKAENQMLRSTICCTLCTSLHFYANQGDVSYSDSTLVMPALYNPLHTNELKFLKRLQYLCIRSYKINSKHKNSFTNTLSKIWQCY